MIVSELNGMVISRFYLSGEVQYEYSRTDKVTNVHRFVRLPTYGRGAVFVLDESVKRLIAGDQTVATPNGHRHFKVVNLPNCARDEIEF